MTDQSETPQTLAEAFAMVNASGMPLRDRLRNYARFSKTLAPEISDAYERLIARLATVEWQSAGPQIGDAMPRFVLPDHEGKLVELEAMFGRGPIVLSFNRGHWCPYCRMELQEMARIQNDLQACGAEIISIQPEVEDFTAKQVAERQLPFRVLTDLDLSYALELGLAFWIGEELEAIYQSRGIDIGRFQRSQGVFLPVPASFVLRSDGLVAARHIDPDFRDRIDPRELIDQVRAAATR